ncbi:MAG: BON domain-containing protein [Acidobacteria bacterium]|nr:BON domain-containing protein [Acidobacteriota bacterium]MCA1640971.1 BON domain-containing protein [Acidobacteriota bacterium]
MKKLAALLVGTALAALTAACDPGTNGNGNMANTNHSNVNANLNANAANMNAAASRNYNARITKEEYERDKERYGREAKEKGETVGQGLTDGWLWVKAKGALAGVDDLRDSTINVDVDDSIVTLRGSVATKEQKAKAEATAKGLDGVKSVKNMLTVGAAGAAGNANAAHNGNHK